MTGLRKGGYAATLGALVVAGGLVCAGVALADDDDGGSQNGANGHDGTATTHCKQKFSTDVDAPVQCYASTPSDANEGNGGDGSDERSDSYDGHGRDGANGTSTNNGPRTSNATSNGSSNESSNGYKNPVTGETHTIPLPNIG
jgi:hypothetical protein